MLLDLALVTQTLLALIREHVANSPLAGKLNALSTTAQPPDKLTGNQTVAMYLYHLSEDPHYKNLPSPGLDSPPVRFTPMALALQYLLTASSQQQGSAGAELEQTMMGAAVKALRDYPIIDDTTEIGGIKILHADLQGKDNRLRVVLHPVPPQEAVQYWNAGSQSIRLAAYYQVSVILLEPPEVRSKSGRVLKYGVTTLLRGSPRLDTSRNRISFTIPGETAPRTVEARPAEAAVGQAIEFMGSDLAADQTTLLVKDDRFDDFVEVSGWGVATNGSVVFATVGAFIDVEPTLPGVYSAMAKVTTQRRMPDGAMRDFSAVSNATAFLVAPSITAVSPPNVNGEVDITGSVFQHPDLKATDIVLYIGSERLDPRVPPAALLPGQFEVLNATTVRFRFPVPEVVSGTQVPLRLMIRGAENAPLWVPVP